MDDSGETTTKNDGAPAATDEAPGLSGAALLEQLKDRAIDFFSNASNETLGICLAGLGVSTYIVLGRVGLVLIGVVGGVALSTYGLHGHGDDGDGKKLDLNRRRETGVEVARRLLDLRANQTQNAHEEEPGDEILDFTSFRPSTAQALRKFCDALINDYVK